MALLSWSIFLLMADLTTVAISIFDVACDALVTHEFYLKGRTWFFISSLVIFVLAQTSYTMLFIATFASKWSNSNKIFLFLAMFPLGQLVPFLTWVEAFHVKEVDMFLCRWHLQPTMAKSNSAASSVDGLWTFVQDKYQAHIGFLLEAVIEALPQCLLQVCYITIYAERQTVEQPLSPSSAVSTITLLSILISSLTIGSKGYLLSYSIHRPTCIFSCFCFAADTFCLFACAACISIGTGMARTSSNAVSSIPALQYVTPVVLSTGYFALGSLIIAWLSLALFMIVDDHLKIRRRLDNAPEVNHVAFELYVVRASLATLGLVPAVVFMVTARTSLAPIILMHIHGCESEAEGVGTSAEQLQLHAEHSKFFRVLFRFLRPTDPDWMCCVPDKPQRVDGGGEKSSVRETEMQTSAALIDDEATSTLLAIRLKVASDFFKQAKQRLPRLQHQLRGLFAHVGAVNWNGVQAVKYWANALAIDDMDTVKDKASFSHPHSNVSAAAQVGVADQEPTRGFEKSSVAALATVRTQQILFAQRQLRAIRAWNGVAEFAGGVLEELVERSEILLVLTLKLMPHLCSSFAEHRTPQNTPIPLAQAQSQPEELVDGLLHWVGLMCLGTVILACFILLPSAFCLGILTCCMPLLLLSHFFSMLLSKVASLMVSVPAGEGAGCLFTSAGALLQPLLEQHGAQQCEIEHIPGPAWVALLLSTMYLFCLCGQMLLLRRVWSFQAFVLLDLPSFTSFPRAFFCLPVLEALRVRYNRHVRKQHVELCLAKALKHPQLAPYIMGYVGEI